MDEIYYSEILKERFKIKQNRIVFESNVNYTMYEKDKMNGADDMTIKNVHMAKKIFGGKIL